MNFFQNFFNHSSENKAIQLSESGSKLYSRGEFIKALQSFQQAKDIYQNINDSEGEAMSLGNMGNCYRFLGDYEKAFECQEQRLEIAHRINNQLMIGRALGDIGTLHEAQGDHKKALEQYKQHLKIAQENSSLQDEANALGNIGNAHYFLSEFEQALDFQEQSLLVTQKVKDIEGEILVLSAIGNTYLAKGEFSKAVEYQLRSLKIVEANQYNYYKSYTLGNLGQAYQFTGEYRRAIECYEACLGIVRAANDTKAEAQVLGSIGSIYHFLGHYSQSADYREQALTLLQQLGDKFLISQALVNLGVTYLAIKDQEKALSCFQESLQIKQEVSDQRGEVIVLGNLALHYSIVGQTNLSQQYLLQSLDLAKKIGFTYGEAQGLVKLGISHYAEGSNEQAITCFQEALHLAQNMGDLRFQAIIYEDLGRVFFHIGQIEEAEKMLWFAIEIHDSLRDNLGFDDFNKVSLFDTQQNAYHLLQKVLVTQGKTNVALEVAERSRARAFVELISRRNATLSQANTYISIDQISLIAQTQKATIVAYSVVYLNKVGKTEQTTLDLYIWVVQATGKIHFQEVDFSSYLTKIIETPTHIFDSIGVRGRGLVLDSDEVEDTAELQEAFRLLIQPIAQFLPKEQEQRVIFIPQFFVYIPFCALIDENGKYLIETHTIQIAPSIQVLDLAQKRKNQLLKSVVSEALVVGNPIMPRIETKEGILEEVLEPLIYAEQEAEAVAQLLNTKPLIQANATKTAIIPKMQNARIIHLATHGLLDDFSKTEIPGAIALAPSDTDNGLLSAEEILSLELHAELVVLSACSSAHGRITSDGVIGLSRSFLSAGASSVLVSLWAIPDQSTAFLMTQFYKNLHILDDKAQALRQAMLATMKIQEYSAPKNWAAFTLIGEP